ncbi:MAG: J domain-containing protein, partial [Terracidiphilus sp.]
MPCVCDSCEQHAHILGLDESPRTRAVLRKSYRSAAKLWHPDHYERDPVKRTEAEERFKLIQVAYRELTEHFENPVQWLIETAFTSVQDVEPFNAATYHADPDLSASDVLPNGAPRKVRTRPPIYFGNAPGCFVAPDFSATADHIIMEYVREPDCALAIVDLTGPGSLPGSLAQFILLTDQGIVVRNIRNIVSLLWFSDMGEVRLVPKRRSALAGVAHRIFEYLSGTEQRYALEIRRYDGSIYCSIAGQVDDSI